MVSLVVPVAGLQAAIHDYARATRGDGRAAARRAAVLLARNALAITPPGDGLQTGQRAVLTKQDQRRGEAAIAKDLAVLFSPVRLKNKRAERHPDVDGIHREWFIREGGKRRGQARGRSRGQPLFVDERKVRALRRRLFSRVGRLAAFWGRGFAVLGLSMPAWVRRHSALGIGRLDETAGLWRFEIGNTAIPASLVGEMERRMGYAERYAARALMDNLAAVLAKQGARFSGRR